MTAAGPSRAVVARLLLALALVAAPLAIIALRVAHLSSRALRAGDAADAAGDAPRAVRFYVEAAAQRLPALSSAPAAVGRLERMARRAADSGDTATETLALREIGAAEAAAGGGRRAVPTLIALIGFAIWAAGLVLFVLAGVDKRLRLRPRWATLSGGMFVVGFALFLIGLRLA